MDNPANHSIAPTPIDWYCKSFNELSNTDLYLILQLRNRIFVVEQNCVYQDCDGIDMDSFHLFAKTAETIICCSRLIPPGISYPHFAAIGRVVVDKAYRNQEIGTLLMKKSIEKSKSLFGSYPVKISAQYHLKDFYKNLGFIAEGAPFDEDGIPHISMTLPT